MLGTRATCVRPISLSRALKSQLLRLASTSAHAISNGSDFAAATSAAMPTTTEASEESLRELQDVIHTPEHQMEIEMVEDVRHKGIESEERGHQVASRFSVLYLPFFSGYRLNRHHCVQLHAYTWSQKGMFVPKHRLPA